MADSHSQSFQLRPYEQALSVQLLGFATPSIPGLQRLLASQGKRLRPRMIFAIVMAAGREVDAPVVSAACAIELVHIASLIHDDALDNGSRRWGVPTINAQEGLAMSLLAGDYLLAQAGGLAANVSTEMADIVASAIARMCEGQALEVSDLFNVNRDVAAYTQAASGKTAALFEAACLTGAHLAELETETTKHLQHYARNLGICYQIYNDIEDFVTPGFNAVKISTSDYAMGNYTLPLILSLQGENRAKLQQALRAEDHYAVVTAMLEADGSIQKAKHEAIKRRKKALDALHNTRDPKLVNALSLIVDAGLN